MQMIDPVALYCMQINMYSCNGEMILCIHRGIYHELGKLGRRMCVFGYMLQHNVGTQ